MLKAVRSTLTSKHLGDLDHHYLNFDEIAAITETNRSTSSIACERESVRAAKNIAGYCWLVHFVDLGSRSSG